MRLFYSDWWWLFRRKYKKKGVVTNGAPIHIYNHQQKQPIEVFSSTDNVFEVPPPAKKAPSVYSLHNESIVHGELLH